MLTIFPALSIYFDVGEAFDTVPHHMLLSKLENFRFDLGFLHLFNSYFPNRYQSVEIKKSVSFPSLLPLVCPKVVYWARFYSFYSLTTLPKIFQTVNSIGLLMISKIFTSADASLFQNEIDSLQRWCSLHCLEFHPLKCKAMNFDGFDEKTQLMLGSHCLLYVDKIENLGKNLS